MGSNLGDREAALESALLAVSLLPGTKVVRRSTWYENPAVGIADGHDFLNAVAEIETTLSPRELLNHLLEIERRQGRERSAASTRGAYENRTLDLDLLLYGDLRIEEEGLVVPHPRMLEREFVLMPLKELGIEPPHKSI